jgi:hypothetical protein
MTALREYMICKVAGGQPEGPYMARLLTQGDQGGRLAPLAWRFHKILTYSPLNLHAI